MRAKQGERVYAVLSATLPRYPSSDSACTLETKYSRPDGNGPRCISRNYMGGVRPHRG